MTQQATQKNPEKPKPTCHHCKKSRHYRNQCRQLKRKKDQAKINTNNAGNNNNSNVGQTNSTSNNEIPEKTNAMNMNNQKDRKPGPVYPPGETCGKTNHDTEKCYFGAKAANRPPPRNRRQEGQIQEKNAQNNSDVNDQAAAQTLN